MKLRVLIADPDPDLQRMMTALLSQEEDLAAAGVSSDGLEALSQIRALHPDVVLLELVQPRLDGLGVLRRLAGQKDAPPVLVLTGFFNAAVAAECADLGAAYFMPKPCDTAELIRRLRQCAQNPAAVMSEQAIVAPKENAAEPQESIVTDILHDIGVPAHIKGYPYLREGILLMLRDADSITGVTKVLYPEVAKKFSTTPSCVERAMRHAIEIAWSRGDEDTRQKIFHSAVSGRMGKPTNGEFIATIAEHVSRRLR